MAYPLFPIKAAYFANGLKYRNKYSNYFFIFIREKLDYSINSSVNFLKRISIFCLFKKSRTL
jgi:hypothetical protein